MKVPHIRMDILAGHFLTRVQNGIELNFVSDVLLNSLIDELEAEREYRNFQRTALVSKITGQLLSKITWKVIRNVQKSSSV